ncbi:hypothetical protein SALBM311S_10142 [Streptomyces alboniger]
MVFLGVRPQGGTPGWHVMGRETFLAPVTWTDDGWPVIGDIVSPTATDAPFRDDFDQPEFHPSWISVRDRSPEHCTTKERPGSLTLRARGSSLDDPDVVFIGCRQQQPVCRASALVDATQGVGGLAVRLDERHHYSIETDGTQVLVISRVGSVRAIVTTRPVPEGPTILGVRITPPPEPHGPLTGPDVVSLGVEQPDGTFTALATLDGRYLSTEVAGGFTGRVIGLYAAGHRPRRLVRPRTAARLSRPSPKSGLHDSKAAVGETTGRRPLEDPQVGLEIATHLVVRESTAPPARDWAPRYESTPAGTPASGTSTRSVLSASCSSTSGPIQVALTGRGRCPTRTPRAHALETESLGHTRGCTGNRCRTPPAHSSRASSQNMALAQPNQSRVNRPGSSTWKLSCIRPVPAVVVASVRRACVAASWSPVRPAAAIASGQT